jgi:hypothetical protein
VTDPKVHNVIYSFANHMWGARVTVLGEQATVDVVSCKSKDGADVPRDSWYDLFDEQLRGSICEAAINTAFWGNPDGADALGGGA